MSLKDFQLVKKLGEGAYSSVYQVMRLEDKQLYALKKVKLSMLSNKQRQNALNQVRILASVNSPGVVSYKQAFIDETSKALCIVMEYASGGDLSQKIQKHGQEGSAIEQKVIWSTFIQMIQGLKTLHEMGIFHRDIKSANIFLFDNGNAKLGDMNVSKICQKGLCMTQTGTPYYASPEVWKDQPYDSKSDIWSIGCVLYEMITLKPPFTANDMEGLYKKVIRGIYPRIPQNYSHDLADLVRALLQTNPSNRPTCDKILKMASVLKRLSPSKQRQSKLSQRSELLRTIRAGQNIYEINNQLPKANYNLGQNRKISKSKMMKNLIDRQLQQEKQEHVYQTFRNGCSLGNGQIIQSLPYLEKDSKVKGQSSERPLVRKKSKAKVVVQVLEKKRSHTDCERDIDIINGLHYHYQNGKEPATKQKESGIKQSQNQHSKRQIKLPKVLNRYNRDVQKMRKQRSLKVHRLH